jgi:DNA-directed RNA polymerase II subunit RPB1
MSYQTEFDYNGSVEKVKGIKFGIMSPEKIRQQSVVEVTTHDTFNGNDPVMGGLFDHRMGVLEYGMRCGTDMHTNKQSPGYFGHIEMSMPVFFHQYFGMTHKVMRCVCFKCGGVLVKLDEADKKKMLEKKKKNRWVTMFELCKKAKICPHCELVLPDKYVKVDLCKVVAEWLPGKETEGSKVPMTPEYTLRLFERLTDEDCSILGFDPKYSHPRSMICQVFPVCPPSCRPSVKQDNGQRMEDDLTIKYSELVKYNNILGEKIKNGSTGRILEDWRNVVQYHAATLIDNEIAGVLPAAQRSGRPLKALRQRLKAKEGRIRGNLMGKRVDFSARTVITPDPVIDLDELGVPKKIAQQLTFPEKVTPNNMEQLKTYIRNGAKNYPGARSVYKNKTEKTISLNYVDCNQIASKLEIGDIVIRHIIDGDVVLFNRQPSLHKMSMMGHRIRVLDGLTFRLNVAATTPYNADFDGDEMNMHVPQSIATRNELECLASLHRQIISPAYSSPIITFVQDCVVGGHLLTMDKFAFTHRELMNLMSWNKSYSGSLGTGPKFENKVYSGIEVLSLVVPDMTLNIKNKSGDTVEIVSGQIKKGVFDKKVFTILIDLIYRDKGPKVCLAFFNNTQHILRGYLMKHSFSVGIQDLMLSDKLNNEITQGIDKYKANVEKRIKTIHLNLFENLSSHTKQVDFENKVYQDLQSARSHAENILEKEFKDVRKPNRFMNMVNSGSKGKLINLAQMTACLGSQAIDGKRVPYGFTNRTLPHFSRFSDGAESRGFVQSSFKKGLNPLEYFFHAMGGREGLIDTAVKTSSTGYLQRKLMKALEDMNVKWNGTVSDANNHIVEFLYGDDSSEGTTVERQFVNVFENSFDDLELKYKMDKGEWIQFLTKPAYDTMVASPKWQETLSIYYEELIEMRKFFIEVICENTIETIVTFSVNIDRLLKNCLLSDDATEHTDLDPVTILKNYDVLLKSCEISDLNKGVWMFKFLLYLNASPKHLLTKKMTKKAFASFLEIVEATYKKTRVEPGEAVGPIAAQSLGEPCTQLTLNSVTYETEIIIRDSSKHIQKVKIGDFVVKNIRKNPEKTQYYKDKDTTWTPILDEEYYEVPSVDEDGNMTWEKIEAVTQHPVVNKDGSNTLLKVTTEQQREVTATKAKSFLQLIDGKVIEAAGENLAVGQHLLVSLMKIDFAEKHFLDMKLLFSPSEFIYQTEVEKAKAVTHEHRWWMKHSGRTFVVPYSRSDSFLVSIVPKRQVFKPNCVYPKNTGRCCSHIPENMPMDYDFGYLVGAYCAEGCTTNFQVSIANNDDDFLVPVKRWCEKYGVTTKVYTNENKNQEGWKSQDIRLYSKMVRDLLVKLGGRLSHLKEIHDSIIFSNRECILGFLDAYIGGDGSVNEKEKFVSVASTSKKNLLGVQQMLNYLGVYAYIKMHKKQTKNNRGTLPENIQQMYTMILSVKESVKLSKIMKCQMKYKQKALDGIKSYESYNVDAGYERIYEIVDGVQVQKKRQGKFKEMYFDKIKSIEEVPCPSSYVYDLTVENTRNFVIFNGLAIVDTFHLSGVGNNNVTRGVPRLQELFHLSKYPKQPSLTVFLKEPLKYDKTATQKIGSELEITLLKDLLSESGIYYEAEKHESKISKSDQEILSYYREFEDFSDEYEKTEIKSKWVLRLILDNRKLLAKGLEMEDIYYAIKCAYKDVVECIFTDDNSSELIMRIRINEIIEATRGGEEYDIFSEKQDDVLELKKIENYITHNIVIKGISGINSAMLRAEKRTGKINTVSGKFDVLSEWILDTNGSNLLDVMTHPAVDCTRIFTNDIFECYDVFGVEVTRLILIKEIFDVIDDASDVDRRHIQLLVDTMTAKGTLISIDRNGMKATDAGPLAKCSFEEADQQLYKAAIFGDSDDLNGVSGNIMLGQAPPVGTGIVDISLDEELFEKYYGEELDEDNLDNSEDAQDVEKQLAEKETYCDEIDFDFSM